MQGREDRNQTVLTESGGGRRKTELLFHEGRERKQRHGIHLQKKKFSPIALLQNPDTPAASEPDQEKWEERGIQKPPPSGLLFGLLLPAACTICYPCHHPFPWGLRSTGGAWGCWRSPRDDSWRVGGRGDFKGCEGSKADGGSQAGGWLTFPHPRSALATLAENSGPACWMERTDGQSAKGTSERANSQHLSRAYKSKPANSNHRLLDRQQLWPEPGCFWLPPLPPFHFISFKTHRLISNLTLPQSPSSGVRRQLLTPEPQDCSPLLALLQLSHSVHHQVLLSPPWKHPWDAQTAFHFHGHCLGQATTISALNSHHGLCARLSGVTLASFQFVLWAAASGAPDSINLNLPSS